MRNLTSHIINGLNEDLEIEVNDQPGAGNACHEYTIRSRSNPSVYCRISFQNGPIGAVGFNGISQEALLAVVEDRLLGFQSGEFSTKENAVALTKVQEAMLWLQKRTNDRLRRGVEGTNQK
jgi:hypothetical protein